MTTSGRTLFLLAALAASSSSSDFCRAKDGDVDCDKQTNREVLAKLREANALSALVEQDEERSRVLLEALEGRTEDTLDVEADGLVRDKFHQVTALTTQTHCTVGKRVGGRWMAQCGFFRGDSFVCLDALYESEDSGEDCIVYSFGVAKTEWGLERALGKAGCTVRLFDPVLEKAPEDVASLEHHKFGLADQSGTKEVIVPGGQGQKVTLPITTKDKCVW